MLVSHAGWTKASLQMGSALQETPLCVHTANHMVNHAELTRPRYTNVMCRHHSADGVAGRGQGANLSRRMPEEKEESGEFTSICCDGGTNSLSQAIVLAWP